MGFLYSKTPPRYPMGWIRFTCNETHPVPLQVSESRRATFKSQTSTRSWGLGAVTVLGKHIFPRGWDQTWLLSPPLPSVVWLEAWGPLVAYNHTTSLELGEAKQGEPGRGQAHRHSPYTAMVFVSCRMAFPAETCTVMVFIPSEVNLNDMLPSKVIRGWNRWGHRVREQLLSHRWDQPRALSYQQAT